jgi:cytochrome c-type biogenesis protein CcmH/NrfG
MKKESLLMLVAGVVLGAVIGFIVTREYYTKKMAAQPPAAPGPAAPAQGPGQEGPGFDPGQHDAMLAQIVADLEKEPANVEKRIMMGNIYYDRQKFKEAAGFYEQALKLQPDDTDVIVDLGVCYRNTGRLDEALAMFDKALAIQPDKKQALYNKVVVYGIDKGDEAKAREIIRDLKAKHPDDPMVKELEQALQK